MAATLDLIKKPTARGAPRPLRCVTLKAFAGLLAVFGAACGSPAPSNERATADARCSAIEILVGFGIGGGTDLFSRTLAGALRKDLGAPVQVVNITGGSGVSAFRELMKRPANGCTLLALTSDYVVLHTLQPKDVDLNRLAPLARAHTELGLLSGRADGPASWDALVALAKAEDRRLLIGGVGARSFDRAAVDITLADAGIAYRYIPYSGAKAMQTDLFGGRLDAVYDEFGVMKPVYEAGAARPFMVFNDEPIALLPDTPTASALGLNVAPSIWRGVAMHWETPGADIDRLALAIGRALQSDSYKTYEAQRRLDLMQGGLSAADFTTALASDQREFAAVLIK
ncbi:MAG: tripartite tricarboxylate transporter substrate binding protein [Pseudomonadota bacterium]